MDGGKGQLTSAIKGMAKSGVHPYNDAAHVDVANVNRGSVAVCSLAKENEEVFIPGVKDPVNPSQDSAAMLLLRQLRDESHRFALRSHRSRRSIVKSM